MPLIYFAWLDAPAPFDALVHAVFDEEIISLTISQDEGDFASAEIDVRNPGGLLAPGRLEWCWISTDGEGGAIVPLFQGRLVALPESVTGEAVRLMFRAKPPDYSVLKTYVAGTLKVLPYWDPVWITGDTSDEDSVLATYGARWHIARDTLDLTISDELEGEDGVLVIGEADALYDNLAISYGEKPKRKAKFKGTLTWKQTGSGTIDLTEDIYHLFRTKKSIYVAQPRAGIISTLTGDGLKSSWPTGGTTIDGGWTVNLDTECVDADTRLYAPYTFDVDYIDIPPGDTADSAAGASSTLFTKSTDYTAKFPVGALKQTTKFDWLADRARTEILEFALVPDIQALDDDFDDAAATITLTISASDTVTEPDDLGDMPIVYLEREAYLNTDRGTASVHYALLLSRAQLRLSARAVEITARVGWALGIQATLRMDGTISDPRLPGGTATGKIIRYQMVAGGDGAWYADITVGCAIGHGGTTAASPGVPVYADPGYMDSGYQMETGGDMTLVPGELVYETLDDFQVDTDGVDLLTLDDVTAVESLTLTGGLSDQVTAITSAADPIETLKLYPSVVTLQLVPVANQSFSTTYSPLVATLPVPKQIDLEAA